MSIEVVGYGATYNEAFRNAEMKMAEAKSERANAQASLGLIAMILAAIVSFFWAMFQVVLRPLPGLIFLVVFAFAMLSMTELMSSTDNTLLLVGIAFLTLAIMVAIFFNAHGILYGIELCEVWILRYVYGWSVLAGRIVFLAVSAINIFLGVTLLPVMNAQFGIVDVPEWWLQIAGGVIAAVVRIGFHPLMEVLTPDGRLKGEQGA